jgi:hypothetical protein
MIYLMLIGAWLLWLVLAGAGIWLAWLVSGFVACLAVRLLVRACIVSFFFAPGIFAAGHAGAYVPAGFIVLYGTIQRHWETSRAGLWPWAVGSFVLWGLAYLVARVANCRDKRLKNDFNPVNAPPTSTLQVNRQHRHLPD